MTVSSVTIVAPPTGPDAPAATPAPAAEQPNTPTAPQTLPNGAPATPERPAWLPEKFKDAEQLAAAYGELEKAYSGRQQAPQQDTQKPMEASTPATTEGQQQGDQQTPQQPNPADQSVPDLLKANGFDYDALTAEVAQNGGKLTDKSYGDLTAKFGKATVDNYFAGQEALAREYTSKVHEAAGGKEGFEAALSWAVNNLDTAAKQAFNDAVNSRDMAKASLAVQGLMAQHAAAVGSEPNLIGGGQNGGVEAGFASVAEQVAAMRDPRYANDPAYRKTVERRSVLMK